MSKDFRQLVAEKFPAGTDNLYTLLGTTKNRVTRLLSEKEENWPSMTIEELNAWAAVLQVDRSELVLQYGCGKKVITIDEAEQYFPDAFMREEQYVA